MVPVTWSGIIAELAYLSSSRLKSAFSLYCWSYYWQLYVWLLLSFVLQILQVRGVRPMSLSEMANLFNNLRLLVCPGLVSSFYPLHLGLLSHGQCFLTVWFAFQDPNANNLIASTTFYSESTRAMLCLVRFGFEYLVAYFSSQFPCC